MLSNSSGIIIDSLEIPLLLEDHSLGRLPDGNGDWTFFETPSPESSNANGTNYYLATPPTFLTQQYFYESSHAIELSCEEPNCHIRFTRDGSIPNENSELYTQPFIVDTTTTIRAVTFQDTLYPSLPSTQTYFINTHQKFTKKLATLSLPKYTVPLNNFSNTLLSLKIIQLIF